MKWESPATFSSPTSISLAFPVAGGRKIELAVARFLSSGRGSHETTNVYSEAASYFQTFLTLLTRYLSVDGGGDFISFLFCSWPIFPIGDCPDQFVALVDIELSILFNYFFHSKQYYNPINFITFQTMKLN
jgi:hypothetical protein